MPIIELQRRLREVGRIRIGVKVETTDRNGKPRQRPKKLDAFRLTSQDPKVIEVAADLWGGEAQVWEDAPDGTRQWQVFTKANTLDIIVPPGQTFSQWFELWSGGGCQRRCDGITEHIGDQPCLCDPDPAKRECDYHTRLSVMLRDLPGLGVWRLDTQGYYAAVELAGAVDVCQAATQRGAMLPARLRLEQRQVKRPGEPIKRFAVPVLDVDVTIGALTSARTVTFGELAGAPADTGATAAPRGLTPVDPEALPPGPNPTVAEQALEPPEPGRRRANAAQPVPPAGIAPRTAAEVAAGAPPPPTGDEGAAPRARANGADTITRRSQMLVIKAREAGLDDDGRHELVRLVTGGRTDSTKDVTSLETTALVEILDRVIAGEDLPDVVDELLGDPELDEALPAAGDQTPVIDTTAHEPEPERPGAPTDGSMPTDVAGWQAATKAAGIRMSEIIRWAAQDAAAINTDPPGNLAQLVDQPELAELVWIRVIDRSEP